MKRVLIIVLLGCVVTGPAWAACPTATDTFKNAGGTTNTLCIGGAAGTAEVFQHQILDSASVYAFPAVGALSDALANPTEWTIGANLLGWDATNSVWRRLQVAAGTGTLNVGVAVGSNIIGKVDILGNAGATLDGVIGAATAPNNMLAVGGVFNSSPLSLTAGQSAALQSDATGVLKINCFVNCSIGQGSTTSGENGTLVMGAVTASPPSYTTAQTDPVSLDLNGGLRMSPVCNKVINITQTATTDVHTFTGFGYICSIMLVSATAQSIGIDEGTGTTCETSGTALIGVSSTASATPQVPLAANGGFSMVSGVPLMRTQVSADHLCVLQSGTGQVAGTITYADLTN